MAPTEARTGTGTHEDRVCPTGRGPGGGLPLRRADPVGSVLPDLLATGLGRRDGPRLVRGPEVQPEERDRIAVSEPAATIPILVTGARGHTGHP